MNLVQRTDLRHYMDLEETKLKERSVRHASRLLKDPPGSIFIRDDERNTTRWIWIPKRCLEVAIFSWGEYPSWENLEYLRSARRVVAISANSENDISNFNSKITLR